MRKSILLSITILLFSLAAAIHAQKAEDYPITVHVYRTGQNYTGTVNLLEVTIEGRKLALQGTSLAFTKLKNAPITMKIGDYKARIIKEDQIDAARYTRRYEFLLSDGKKLEFDVVGESEN
jgi:hypothetical protein